MTNRVPSIDATLAGGEAVPAWRMGDRLRRAREWAGLDQQQLAERTGLSRASISAAERGHRHPHRSSMRLWAIATGVSLAWLEQGEVVPEPAEDEPAEWWQVRAGARARVA